MKGGDIVTSTLGCQTPGSVAVIALPDPAVAGSVLTLRSRSERALGDNSRAIAIDLRNVQRIDTQTLSELCVALRSISRHETVLAVVGADQRVRWALTLCEIDGLEFHHTINSALARSDNRQRKLKRSSRDGRTVRGVL
jgi:anti-anti-sigma regulatory factor